MNRLKHLHLQPVGGAAGDMLLAALCDLGPDTKHFGIQDAVRDAMGSLGIEGLKLDVRRVEVNGEAALYVKSIPRDPEPHHRHLSEVFEIIDAADAAPEARSLARRIFTRLGEAEAAVHGADEAHSVHLHEVGQLDSVLDVLGIAVALHHLGNPQVSCGPLPSGCGTVSTAHGVLDCPVPAVREIARRAQVPLFDSPLVGETITPTGIAVIAEVCVRFQEDVGSRYIVQGVGAGTRRFDACPNVLRAYGFAQDNDS